jgi:hypothetical protein
VRGVWAASARRRSGRGRSAGLQAWPFSVPSPHPQATKVLAMSEQQARNTHKLAYDEAGGFAICAASLTPIPKGAETLRSPYCGAAYHPKFRGTVCVIDGMSQVGVETLGLVNTSGGGAAGGGGRK